MINALEEEKQRALLLKTRSEDFVNCIERSGQGGPISGNDEGVISLDYNSKSKINNYISNCTNEDYVKLNSNFNNIENILNELEYTSFGISGEVDSVKTSVKDQTESLTEFDNSYNAYYTGVKDMESNICSVFSKISGVNGGLFKNSSIISPSGDVDKNQLRDVMLKKEDGLTDDDKVTLDYLEKILGKEEYSKLKGIMLKNSEDLTDAEKKMLEQVKNIYSTNDLEILTNDSKISYEKLSCDINTGKVYSPIGTKDKNGNIISFVDACRLINENMTSNYQAPDFSALGNQFDLSVIPTPGNLTGLFGGDSNRSRIWKN